MTVLELLSEPKKWTQKAFCRDKDGNRLSGDMIHAPEACSWCLVGAILRCYAKPDWHRINPSTSSGLVQFNDTSTYEQVIAKVKELGL